MGTDNKIDACYMTQAQNLFKKLKLNPKGVKIKEEAMQLFSTLPFGASKYAYIESIDTDKDGNISVQELASVFQRADKEGYSSKLAYNNALKDDRITNITELSSDFAQHSALPFLLNEAKKHSPEKYSQIEQKLKTGTFSITGEQDYNLLHKEQDGINRTNMISEATRSYENLALFTPGFKKMFFEHLASGNVAQYDTGNKGKELTVKQDRVNTTHLNETEILQTETTYPIDNPQKTISVSKPRPVSKLQYTPPKNLPQSLEADPIEKLIAKEICEKVLTPEQVKKYEKDILKTTKDKKSFTQFAENLGAKINQTLKIKPSLSITNEKFKEKGGFYDNEKNEIVLSYPAVAPLQKSIESMGVPNKVVKQILLKTTIGIIAHEYGHAAQYAFIKNSPKKATPEENIAIAKYKQNFNEYLYPTDAITLYGSMDKYMTQPIENSSLNLMLDIKKHINKILKNKKNKVS